MVLSSQQVKENQPTTSFLGVSIRLSIGWDMQIQLCNLLRNIKIPVSRRGFKVGEWIYNLGDC